MAEFKYGVQNADMVMQDLIPEIINTMGVAEDFDGAAQTIVDAIPPATRQDFFNGTDNNYVAAANYWPTYKKLFEGDNNNDGSTDVTKTQDGDSKPSTRQKAKYTAPELDDAAKKAFTDIAKSRRDEIIERTKVTTIQKLLVENPKPSEMYKGLTVVPKCNTETLAKYEANLVEDAKVAGNKAAFDKVKAAVESATPMEVYCNDSSRKFQGVIINTRLGGQEGKEASTESIQMTLQALAGFLLTKVMGRIGSETTGIGVKVKDMSAVTKGKSKADKTATQGKPQLGWVGKAEPIRTDDKTLVVALNQIKMSGTGKNAKPEVCKKSLRIKESFVVYQTDSKGNRVKDSKGAEKTKTIHLSGECLTAPVMERKPEFVAVFKQPENRDVITSELTADAENEFLALQMGYISSAASGQLQYVDSKDLTDLVSQINAASKGAAKDAAEQFE